MYITGPCTQPVPSIFGAAFIPEQHVEGDQRKLPPIDQERRFADFTTALRGLVFAEPIAR